MVGNGAGRYSSLVFYGMMSDDANIGFAGRSEVVWSVVKGDPDSRHLYPLEKAMRQSLEREFETEQERELTVERTDADRTLELGLKAGAANFFGNDLARYRLFFGGIRGARAQEGTGRGIGRRIDVEGNGPGEVMSGGVGRAVLGCRHASFTQPGKKRSDLQQIKTLQL